MFSRSQPTRSALHSTFVVLTFAAAGMGALLALFPAAGHDQLWFLLMAQRWLHGATLYGPEAFDSNPPAIVWASALPVLMGHFLHVAATLPAKTLVLLVEALCGWLSWYFLRRGPSAALARQPAGLLFILVVLAVVLPARDFGQRDQLLSVMILPYVLAAAAADSRSATATRIAAGSLATLGICLKPQYALIPVAVEALLLLRPHPGYPSNQRMRTLLRPEPVILILGGAAYLFLIARVTPLYFKLSLPLLRQTYWAVGHLSVPELALQAIELCLLALAASVLFLFSKPRSELVRLLLVSGAAATLAYFLQGTGWYYQQIPGLVIFGAAFGLLLLEKLSTRDVAAPRWMAPAAGALGLLALALTTHFMGYPFTADRAFAITTPDPTFFTGLPPGASVAMLTTSVDDTMMPVERYGLTWAQRTNNLWLLPAILRMESPSPGAPPRRSLSPDQLAALSSLQKRWMVEDLKRWYPQLVLVKRCADPKVECQLLEDRHDDLLAWFLRDPAFADQWSHYSLQRSAGPYDAYILRSRATP